MKGRTVLLALCLGALCGCRRKAAPPSADTPQLTPEQAAQIESQYLPPTNDDATTAPAAAPVADSPAEQRGPIAQQPAKPIQERLNGAVHAQLTLQLRMFIEKSGRLPANFSEFANSAMDSVPLAPNGM